jgi:hypothetical protein
MHPQEQALTFDEEAGVTPDSDKGEKPQDNAKTQEKVSRSISVFQCAIIGNRPSQYQL